MRKTLSAILAVLGLLALGQAPAQAIETTSSQRTAFLAMVEELRTHYGMARFKEEALGVRLDALEHKYLALIDGATTLEEHEGLRPKRRRPILPPDEFRQLMIGFAAEFKDGHTNILRQSRDAWTLGIRTAAVDGRLYVVGFNEDYFNPGSTNPRLEIGDEVLEVGGRPVSEIARENMLYAQRATYETARQMALETILNVPHRRLRPKTTGDRVVVKFSRSGDKPATFSGEFNWVNVKDLGELRSLIPYLDPDLPGEKAKEKKKLKDKPYVFGCDGLKTYFSEGLKKAALARGAVTDIGLLLNTQIEDARKKKEAGVDHDKALAELEAIERLPVYTVRHEGKVLGVVRIPDYSPGEFSLVVKELRWLASAIEILEHSTDALVIDQLHNGGGYVYEFTEFVRLFAHAEDMKTVTIDLRLSDTFFRAYSHVGDPDSDPDKELEGRKKNFAEIHLQREALKRLHEAFARGEKWSGQVSYGGNNIGYTPGAPGRMVGMKGKTYSKPVLILNDSRSGSGGDFMPATMQANRRALVMGETSMGLGGPVYRGQDSMPGSEMFMRCTMGFCLRGDGLPIENVGVVPDVRRDVTVEDIRGGFADYAKDVLAAAVKLIEGADAAKITEHLAARDKKDAAKADPVSEPLKEALERLARFRTGLAKATGPTEMAGLYASLFESLRTLGTGQLTEADWRKLEIPLPESLTRADPILGSLTRRDEIVARLREMLNLERYQRSRATSELLDVLGEGLSSLGEIRFNGCMALLVRKS